MLWVDPVQPRSAVKGQVLQAEELRSRLDRAILAAAVVLVRVPAPRLPLSPGEGGQQHREGIVVSACISQNGLMGQTEAHLIGK